MITAIVISLTEKFYADKLIFSCITFVIGVAMDIQIIRILINHR